jgi:hypothetical protein
MLEQVTWNGWMLSLAGFHARTYQTPESGWGLQEKEVDYGLSSTVWFARYDPDTSLWRTSQLSLLEDLSEGGYDAEWQVLPASAFGAPHLRNRIFIIAYSNEFRTQVSVAGRYATKQESGGYGTFGQVAYPAEYGRRQGRAWRPTSDGTDWQKQQAFDVADPQSQQDGRLCISRLFTDFGAEGDGYTARLIRSAAEWWAVEPNVGRVANGVPKRVDRLRGLGNAVVPVVAQYVAECVKAHAEAQEAIA